MLGFKKHNEVLDIFKKPALQLPVLDGRNLGRTSLEASANGCAVIITNKGGLPETVTDAKILNSLSIKNLVNTLNLLIKNLI